MGGCSDEFDTFLKKSKVNKKTNYMSQVTRIAFGSIGTGPGSIALPEEVTLSCPQCGTLVGDKGQCIASFEAVPNRESKTGMSLKVLIDCRNCGASMKEPDLQS